MEVAEHPPFFIVQGIILLLVGLSAPNYLSLLVIRSSLANISSPYFLPIERENKHSGQTASPQK
jgi:hypothetical protein